MSTTLSAARRPPEMGVVYRFGWLFFRAFFALFCRWRYFNPERVPVSSPVILASNHASFLDPPLVGAALPRPLAYLARDSLFRFPLAGSLLRAWNVIPVDRDGGGATGLRRILEALEAGHAVIIFPEGTRTHDGQVQPARTGIGLIVLRSNAPVVPVRVFGTFEAYGRHSRFPKPHRVAVKYGKPLHFEVLRAEAQTCDKKRLKQIYQEITDQVMAAITALKPHRDVAQFPP